MSSAELALVIAAVLCAIAFAAVAVTLVRVGDTVRELRTELGAFRAETTAVVAELQQSCAEAEATMIVARQDLDRFDRLLGSAEAISGAVSRGNRLTRAALSTPMIKAAGIATGTSRAVKRFRGEA